MEFWGRINGLLCGFAWVKKKTYSRGHFTLYWFLGADLGIRRTWVDHRSRDSDPGIPIFANLKGRTLTTPILQQEFAKIDHKKTTFLFFWKSWKNVRNPRCHSCEAKNPVEAWNSAAWNTRHQSSYCDLARIGRQWRVCVFCFKKILYLEVVFHVHTQNWGINNLIM